MEQIADYELLGSVSGSGDQRVFVAKPPTRLGSSNETVLVKVVSGITSEMLLRRATDELRIFAAVDSPYLVRILDAGRDGDRMFYVMDDPGLGTLEAPTFEMTDTQKLRAVADAAHAVHALHEAGVAHRNIVPSGILLEPEGARLADLGMAKFIGADQAVSRLPSLGDVEYLDPKIMLGLAPGRATDIWSLGVVLHWVMSGGASLHPGSPGGEVFVAVRQALVEPPVISPDLSPEVAEIVRRALAPEPRDRPATAEDFARQIEAVIAGTS